MPEASVATFNIRHGRGLDDRVDIGRIADVLRRLDADAIALQEIDRFHPRSGTEDQVAELERLSGYRVHFVPTLCRAGWEYGIGLATRDDVGAPVSIELPLVGRVEPRRALLVHWRGIALFATHLAVERAANEAEQAFLAEQVGRHLPRAVVAGDLNATRRHLERLTAAGLSVTRTRIGTLNPWWRFRQIDHVLTGQAIEVLEARVVRTRTSDHSALLCRLLLPC